MSYLISWPDFSLMLEQNPQQRERERETETELQLQLEGCFVGAWLFCPRCDFSATSHALGLPIYGRILGSRVEITCLFGRRLGHVLPVHEKMFGLHKATYGIRC